MLRGRKFRNFLTPVTFCCKAPTIKKENILVSSYSSSSLAFSFYFWPRGLLAVMRVIHLVSCQAEIWE
jgi:hypothetical protein